MNSARSLLSAGSGERFEKNAYLKGHYPEMIAERVERIRARHHLAARREPESPEPFPDDQLELFPSVSNRTLKND